MNDKLLKEKFIESENQLTHNWNGENRILNNIIKDNKIECECNHLKPRYYYPMITLSSLLIIMFFVMDQNNLYNTQQEPLLSQQYSQLLDLDSQDDLYSYGNENDDLENLFLTYENILQEDA